MSLLPRSLSALSLALLPAVAVAQTASLTRARAIEDVLSRSPRSQVLVADTAVALAASITARTTPNPNLTLDYSKDTPNYHIIADYPLGSLFNRGIRVDAARFGRDAARYRYQLGRALVALDADTSYTRALAATEKSRLSARTAQDADSLRAMAIARRNAGDASELDVQLATVSAAQLGNAAASDSLDAYSALLELQALLGLPTDRRVIQLADSLGDPPAVDTSKAGSLLSIAAADAALKSAILSARVQRRSLWNSTGITFGVETHDPGGNGNALLPTFGVALPLPFFDRNHGPIAEAEAEQKRAEFELSLAQIEANAAVRRAARERAFAVGRIARDRITVAAANQVASMSLTAYREGAMALPNVIEAQRTAREALAQYIDDLASAWIATASLRAFSLTAIPTP